MCVFWPAQRFSKVYNILLKLFFFLNCQSWYLLSATKLLTYIEIQLEFIYIEEKKEGDESKFIGSNLCKDLGVESDSHTQNALRTSYLFHPISYLCFSLCQNSFLKVDNPHWNQDHQQPLHSHAGF